ncbi:hypothetical protein AOZ06_04540 [Kibdelosporangium phytohabitans]|uniref:Glycosyltransferase RgtA/B/C/D-like domain-containing protein n=1 Tax=Kibdelosporangium phytohabitans TaxID=860235 RepID=A0A0N9I8E6_9PSEU|nr:hypothetical protein AOZ06_04540 [Kibdelosporangium phytohabitans]
MLAVFAGIVLVVTTALIGWRLIDERVDIFLWFPPLLAGWEPHIGPGTGPALVTAALIVLYGPRCAQRMGWRGLLAAAWAASAAWTMFLALVDGYQRGIADRLTSRDEYLHDVWRVDDIPRMLREFSGHILTDQPDHWTTHVGAHPPGAFLLFVWLDRIGLGGGGAAGIVCVLLGASACVAVAVTLRAVGREDFARTVLPFSVLLPGAVWVGVSADGVLAAVLAWSVALLAIGVTRRGWRADLAAVVGGMLFGFAVHLSYGLVLGGLLVLAVLALSPRWRPALFAALGVVIVVAVFVASGFWWFTGYQLTTIIYADSITKTRPYSYFLWANLAATLFVIGPATVAGLRRTAARPHILGKAAGLLVAAALVAILVADVSGMSKGEVERIWLPFAVWLIVACGALPEAQRRWWLTGQALLALLVNHLLFTPW